ncbi:hypothetical protein ACF06T_29085, partial [Streptomyces albidoflavus]
SDLGLPMSHIGRYRDITLAMPAHAVLAASPPRPAARPQSAQLIVGRRGAVGDRVLLRLFPTERAAALAHACAVRQLPPYPCDPARSTP